jgi:hypothetical protein
MNANTNLLKPKPDAQRLLLFLPSLPRPLSPSLSRPQFPSPGSRERHWREIASVITSRDRTLVTISASTLQRSRTLRQLSKPPPPPLAHVRGRGPFSNFDALPSVVTWLTSGCAREPLRETPSIARPALEETERDRETETETETETEFCALDSNRDVERPLFKEERTNQQNE